MFFTEEETLAVKKECLRYSKENVPNFKSTLMFNTFMLFHLVDSICTTKALLNKLDTVLTEQNKKIEELSRQVSFHETDQTRHIEPEDGK